MFIKPRSMAQKKRENMGHTVQTRGCDCLEDFSPQIVCRRMPMHLDLFR